jgi:membrane protein YqaA with SNARE-associated domain
LLGQFGAYSGLFIAAFLAATILPAQSEAGLAALILASPASVTLLVATASLGNILGSVVNWYLGRGINRFTGKQWFPATADQLSRATGWYHRYGRWSLLLSWVPFIGDPLTVVAGIMREPLLRFLFVVGLAKTGRYIVVALLALQWR